MGFNTLWPIAVAVAVALPLAHLAYTAWVRRRHPLVGEVVMHEGARLHFTRCGAGPAVLLVHGANGTWNDFPPELIADLARDHSVVAMDRPGHGWSEAPRGPLGLAENAAALLAIVRSRRLAPVTLVGHSYGAAVALRAALDAPDLVSHVVAVCPCTVVDQRNARYVAAPLAGDAVGRVLFQFLALTLLPFGLPLRAQAWHPDRPPRGWSASRVFAYVPSQMHASARNFRRLHTDLAWLADRLPKLDARLTVLAGGSDRVTPPAQHVFWLRRPVPAARMDVVSRVGHWLPRLRPDLISAAVREHSGAQAPANPGRSQGGDR
jgi:pimeloyl-ACP methyl ester carboxylesterase